MKIKKDSSAVFSSFGWILKMSKWSNSDFFEI
jgi:hypothetical protein